MLMTQPLLRPFTRLTMLAVVLTLSACGSLTTSDQSGSAAGASWAAQQKQLRKLHRWTASGKIALRNDTASESAFLTWKQNNHFSQLKINGLLGMGTTVIDSDGQTLLVDQGGELRQLDISSPEAIFANTGWQLPLKALPFWLKGLPYPEYAIEEQVPNESGQGLNRLQQDGWLITYEKYGVFEGITLPTRLVAERDDMRLKVFVRKWRDLPG